MANEYNPNYAVHPGKIIREEFNERGIVWLSEFAAMNGAEQDRWDTVIRIIAGKASITPDMATWLESLTNVPARFWNSLQARYEGDLARIAAQKTQNG